MGEGLGGRQDHEWLSRWRMRAYKYAYPAIFGSGAVMAAEVGIKELVDNGNMLLVDPDFGVALALGFAAVFTKA